MIETLSDQWPTAGSGYPWWPLCFHEFNFIVWTFNAENWSLCCYSTLFVRGSIVGILIPSSPSLPTNIFTHSVMLHPRDLVTFLQAIWRNLTEWAQSTFPSRERINPDLDTYASTYPFGIPELHLYGHHVTVWQLMQSKHPLEIKIKYDLTV